MQLTARLAQSAERKALNLVVVGSSPTVGVSCLRKHRIFRAELILAPSQSDRQRFRRLPVVKGVPACLVGNLFPKRRSASKRVEAFFITWLLGLVA